MARLGRSVGPARPERSAWEPRIGRGGAGRGGAGRWASAPLVPLRQPPSFGPSACAPQAERQALRRVRLQVAGLRRCDRPTHGRTDWLPDGARTPAQTRVQSHPRSRVP